MRRTIDINDDVDYLIKAFRAKVLLEMEKSLPYNDVLETLICTAIAHVIGFTKSDMKNIGPEWKDVIEKLKKEMTTATLTKSLHDFINREK